MKCYFRVLALQIACVCVRARAHECDFVGSGAVEATVQFGNRHHSLDLREAF